MADEITEVVSLAPITERVEIARTGVRIFGAKCFAGVASASVQFDEPILVKAGESFEVRIDLEEFFRVAAEQEAKRVK